MNKENFGNDRNTIASITLGVVLSVMLMLMGTFVVSWLLGHERIETDKLGISALIVTEMAAVAGSAFSAIRMRKAILPVAVGTGLGFFVIQLSVTAMLFDGQYQGVLVTLLAVVGASVAVALVVLKYLNQSKKYRKKR